MLNLERTGPLGAPAAAFKAKTEETPPQKPGFTANPPPHLAHFLETLPPPPVDHYSNARPDKAVTTSMELKVHEIDFQNKTLSASVRYEYRNLESGNDQIHLDIEGLELRQVLINGQEARFTTDRFDASKPMALVVTIPSGERGTLEISYSTGKDAHGLFWLSKEQTDTHTAPLFYTQAEAIDGASWLPGQHTPQVRLTWSVAFENLPRMLPVVSCQNNPKERSPEGSYSGLSMKMPVPLYLLGIAVGDFAFHEYDSVCGIYAESEQTEAIGKRFAKLPEFLRQAETLMGRPYAQDWGRYTPIKLPLAYPYNAMEHACATFFGGDTIDQERVWIHEIAHAWAGNLVTNATWGELFLNEGMTMYIENRILEQCLGEEYAKLVAKMRIDSALAQMKQLDEGSCKLSVPFTGQSPEPTRVPYGKGMLFFMALEKQIGRTVWDQMLRDYMATFAGRSICSAWLCLFLERELEHYKTGLTLSDLQAEAWLHSPGIPDNAPMIESERLEEIEAVKQKLSEGIVDVETLKSFDAMMWSTLLVGLLGKLSADQVALLDEAMGLSKSESLLIRRDFCTLAASAGHLTPEIQTLIKEYVIARNSSTIARTIARYLNESEEGKALIASILADGEEILFPKTKEALKI